MERSAPFEKILARHREALGDPLTLDEIFRLHGAAIGEIELAEEERLLLLDQLSTDPEAAARLLKLIRFPETADAETTEDTVAVEERWVAFRDELLAKGLLEQKTTGPPRRESSWPVFLQKLPMAASFLMGIALTLLLGQVLPWNLDGPGSEGSRAQVNLPIVELLDEGTEVRRSAESVQLLGSADGLVVTLTVTRLDAKGTFQLQVVGPQGRTALRMDGLEPGPGGVFVLSLPREKLADGRHRLELTQSDVVIGMFFLEVTLSQ